MGRVDNREFDAANGIAIADVEWVAPCEDTGDHEVVVMDVMPIKNAWASRALVPSLERRRVIGGLADSSRVDRALRPRARGNICMCVGRFGLWNARA